MKLSTILLYCIGGIIITVSAILILERAPMWHVDEILTELPEGCYTDSECAAMYPEREF